MTPEERFTKIENLLAAMTEHQARHDEDIRQIHQTQIASAQILRTTAQLLLTLAGAQKETEERLNRNQGRLGSPDARSGRGSRLTTNSDPRLASLYS